ncbi:MAG: glutathione S-transferase family protein, partial [Pseudomonadota bacterium]
MTLTLVGSILSPFVRKVRIVLAEKSVPYAHEDLIPFLAPDSFSEISPLRRIPVLIDPSVEPNWALPDSSAICSYLERRFPSPCMYPSKAVDLARALWIEEFADTEFSATIGQKIFRPMVVLPFMGGEA